MHSNARSPAPEPDRILEDVENADSAPRSATACTETQVLGLQSLACRTRMHEAWRERSEHLGRLRAEPSYFRSHVTASIMVLWSWMHLPGVNRRLQGRVTWNVKEEMENNTRQDRISESDAWLRCRPMEMLGA